MISRAKLIGRISKLEQNRPIVVATVASPAPMIIAKLTAAGFTRGDNESWAEVCARALGISPIELRNELMRRAYGA